jgi:S-adenosylmethionine/arginine decarboxylase-like enzyme
MWGLLASLNIYDCNSRIDDPEALKQYVVDLCALIKMKRYGECLIQRFGHDDLEGYSIMQFIETSSITGHFSPSTESAYIDVFSCAEFDPVTVLRFTEIYFGGHGKMTVVPRR